MVAGWRLVQRGLGQSQSCDLSVCERLFLMGRWSLRGHDGKIWRVLWISNKPEVPACSFICLIRNSENTLARKTKANMHLKWEISSLPFFCETLLLSSFISADFPSTLLSSVASPLSSSSPGASSPSLIIIYSHSAPQRILLPCRFPPPIPSFFQISTDVATCMLSHL